MRNAQEKITGAVQALPPTFNTVYSHASDISFLDEQRDQLTKLISTSIQGKALVEEASKDQMKYI
ncbi:unnamed protein product [Prunus armeniaca]